jgi:hypothetical protein
MKSFLEFVRDIDIKTLEYDILSIFEDTTSTAGVANPDAKPIGKSKFIGYNCVEVDDETYSNCIAGKERFARWVKYVGDDNLRGELKSMYNKNKRLLIKNSKTGGMVYIK